MIEQARGVGIREVRWAWPSGVMANSVAVCAAAFALIRVDAAALALTSITQPIGRDGRPTRTAAPRCSPDRESDPSARSSSRRCAKRLSVVDPVKPPWKTALKAVAATPRSANRS